MPVRAWSVLVLVAPAIVLPGIDPLPDAPPAAEFIVSFKMWLDETEQAQLEAIVPVDRYYVSVAAALVRLTEAEEEVVAALPFVERTDPNDEVEPHMDRAASLIRANLVAEAGPGGRGVSVAIVDSGIDASHPALAGRVRRAVTVADDGVAEGSVDERGHGTYVASVVAGGAASPYAGIAPQAELVAVDLGDSWNVDGVLRAFDWILDHHREEGVRVVLTSLGRSKLADSFDAGDPLVGAADRLLDEGLVVVSSSGNKGPGLARMSNQALNPRILTVGAVDALGDVAAFSSHGPVGSGKPDVYASGVELVGAQSSRAAPGSQVPGDRIDAGDDFIMADGTSGAAAQVAGLAALLLSQEPMLGPEDVVERVRDAALPRPAQSTIRVVDVAGTLTADPQHVEAVREYHARIVLQGEDVDEFEFPIPAGTLSFHLGLEGVDAGAVRVRAPSGVESPIEGVQGSLLFDADPASAGYWRLVFISPGAGTDVRFDLISRFEPSQVAPRPSAGIAPGESQSGPPPPTAGGDERANPVPAGPGIGPLAAALVALFWCTRRRGD